MHYKKRVLDQVPGAKLVARPGHFDGQKLYCVMHGETPLDDHGHLNRGPGGAWRDAYYWLVRRRHKEVSR